MTVAIRRLWIDRGEIGLKIIIWIILNPYQVLRFLGILHEAHILR
jgi:hypothetical protein